MTEITDDFMNQILSRARDYSIVILKAGANRSRPGAEKIIWEHARRNFLLRARGLLPIVCPITDGGDLAGIGIFNADIYEAKTIMGQDPAVKEGILVYGAHPCRSFPGDCLPADDDAEEKGRKGATDLSKYFGLLKGDPILDRMEADAKFVRDSAKIKNVIFLGWARNGIVLMEQIGLRQSTIYIAYHIARIGSLPARNCSCDCSGLINRKNHGIWNPVASSPGNQSHRGLDHAIEN